KKVGRSSQLQSEILETRRVVKATKGGRRFSFTSLSLLRDASQKKATKIFLKPTPPGSGIKASVLLNHLFKYLEIKDVSAKIIGSRNKLNVIRATFLALDKLTGKKYDY
ncbi:16930_t:CDS:2, partial [Racocetra fulgida]